MSLIQALSTAMSGLTAAQAGLTVTAGNVANAGTPGYVAETPNLVETWRAPPASGWTSRA